MWTTWIAFCNKKNLENVTASQGRVREEAMVLADSCEFALAVH